MKSTWYEVVYRISEQTPWRLILATPSASEAREERAVVAQRHPGVEVIVRPYDNGRKAKG
jgi:hypothetical protein